MSDGEIESTLAARELPILRAALRRLEAADDLPELEDIRQEAAIDNVKQFRTAVTALRDAGYIDVLFTGGWTSEQAAGANIVLPSKVAGHSSPDVTLRVYSHLMPSGAADAADLYDPIATVKEAINA